MLLCKFFSSPQRMIRERRRIPIRGGREPMHPRLVGPILGNNNLVKMSPLLLNKLNRLKLGIVNRGMLSKKKKR